MHGGQWQVLYLVERLSDAVLLAREGSPLFAEAERRKMDVRALSFRALAAGARRADLVHVHDARAHTMAALAGIAPLVVSRRVAFPVKSGFLSGRKYARATLYLAVSNYVAARLLDAGVPGDKIRVVYDGVPLPELGRPRVGRVVALASKPVEIPGVSVELTSNLWGDLSTASVFVYRSDLEGLGSAALAAMAAGVPVVASAVGGLPEVVVDGKTGFLVRDGDFQKPVRRLLGEAALAAQMSRAGRERVRAGIFGRRNGREHHAGLSRGLGMILALLAFAAGLLIGSFLNVCIFRLPRDLSVASPARSFCPECETTIAWYDNIPVVSYLVLGARCRHCKAHIPVRYLLVEIATAAAFALCVSKLGLSVAALKYCIYSAIMIALIASDIEERILPDEFTLGGTVVGLAFAPFVPLEHYFAAMFIPYSWGAARGAEEAGSAPHRGSQVRPLHSPERGQPSLAAARSARAARAPSPRHRERPGPGGAAQARPLAAGKQQSLTAAPPGW